MTVKEKGRGQDTGSLGVSRRQDHFTEREARRLGVSCEMRPEGQAMSAKESLDGQYNILGSVDQGGQHNCR